MSSYIHLLLLALFCFLVKITFAVDFIGNFDVDVVKDERAWIVEYYSPMCGSCQEFAATWTKIEENVKSLATAKVNIDTPEGMKIAQEQGILDEGIPSVQLYASSKRETLMAGDLITHKLLMKKIKQSTSHLTRRDDGIFAKHVPAFLGGL